MEVGSSSADYRLLSESLLQPSTPSRGGGGRNDGRNDNGDNPPLQHDHDPSNTENPTPLRYFFSDSNNNNASASDALLHNDHEHGDDGTSSNASSTTMETAQLETQVQLVALRILGKPFPHTFWFRDWPIAALLGAVLGLATLGFLAAVHGMLNLMFSISDGASAAAAVPSTDNKAHWMWLLVTSVGGFSCGVILLFPQAPSLGTVRTMYHDAMDLKGYPAQALCSVMACFVCLATGAPLGPEMAIGAMGSGLASLVAKRLKAHRRTEAAWVFAGMAGSLGGLFPSPILGVMLVHELSVAGRPQGMTLDAIAARDSGGRADDAQEAIGEVVIKDHDYMEQVTLAGTCAIAAYLVLHALIPHTLPWGHAVFDIGNDYQTWHLAAAIPLGIVSGLVASLSLILLGAFRTIRVKVCLLLEETLGAPSWIGRLFFPTLAGTLHGLLSISNPYLIGSGVPFAVYLIENRDSMKVGWLVLMAFCKAVSMSMSLGFGLVGGPLFPMVFVGLCVGLACSTILPVSLAVPCCMCATVIFVPIPFTLVFYVAISLSLTVQQMTPIFISTFVAYTITGGSGIVRRLGERRLGVARSSDIGDDDLMLLFDDDVPPSDQSLLRGVRNTIFGGS